jgi:toxin-antitoxin system PIN domain toxin
MRALLDTSVLIALLDANHIHHKLCTRWLAGTQGGWASCPITLNGCIRILSQPNYPNRLPMQTVVRGLQSAMAHQMHAFWPDEVDPLGPPGLNWDVLLRPAQITDAYLLALAVRKQACLVTLDQGIALDWVHGADSTHLKVLASSP